MRVSVILLILIFVFSGEALLAQDKADTLKFNSLNEVISLAIKNNPTQAVYQQQINQARYNYKASKGFIYPNASGSFIGTDNLHLAVTPIPGELIGKPGTTFYAQFGKQFNYGTGITLGQDIIDWQSVFQAEIANNNIKLNELQQDSYIQGLKDQVGKLYFSTLTAKASLLIINTDRLLADSIVNLNRQRFAEGTIDAIALNQAVISANNVLQNQAQSQQLYDQSIEN
jgi:outer membrane protein